MATLEQRVMRRVYGIWALRQITSVRALKVYVLLGTVFYIKSAVYVMSVLRNASNSAHDLASSLNFFTDAFANTDLMIQASLLVGAVVGTWFMRDMFSVFGKQQTTRSSYARY